MVCHDIDIVDCLAQYRLSWLWFGTNSLPVGYGLALQLVGYRLEQNLGMVMV
jgi:hypothetical protein